MSGRSESGACDAAIDEIVAAIRAVHGRRPVAVIDGPAGAGKSTLAAGVARRIGAGVQVIHMDDLYDGWGGLADPALLDYLNAQLVPQIRAGGQITHRRYDWLAGGFGPNRTLPVAEVLVIEGVGAAQPALADVADVRIWVDAPDCDRIDRVRRRDGDLTMPHWDRWRAGEQEHYRRFPTRPDCDLVVTT